MDRDTNQALVNTVFSFLGEDIILSYTRYKTTMSAKVRRDGDVGLIMIDTKIENDDTGLKPFQRRQLQKFHWTRIHADKHAWGIRYAQRMLRFAEKLNMPLAAETQTKFREALATLEECVEPDVEYSLNRWWRKKPR